MPLIGQQMSKKFIVQDLGSSVLIAFRKHRQHFLALANWDDFAELRDLMWCVLPPTRPGRKEIDLRITYICAHCGGFAEVSFLAIEIFDNGITLTCDKCGKDTVLHLAAAPKGNPGMPKGYSFRLEACPDCGRLIKENWIIRHRKSGCRLG